MANKLMKYRYRFSHRHRPPWWPENEEWPPKRWRYMRGQPFFRRMGCVFLVFSFLAFTGFLAVLRFILAPFIEIHGAPPLSGSDFILPFGFAGFVILLATIFWGGRTLRRMSMPLDDLLDASKRVADGDYSVRVDAKGPPEVYTLMQGFNAMTERLQVSDQQRRAMLADVSHELRTPITVIQGNVEGILDGMYPADEARLKSILEETQILSRLVDDLRTMALAESGSLQLRREPTSLASLIQDVAAGFESQADEKEIKIEFLLEDVEDIHIDPLRLREVLSNILSNALRYTPRAGQIQVGLAGSGTGLEGGVTVFVHDSGPGIQSADLPHVFDRFYKSSDSGGMGLGLSIAKYLIEAHGGRIWAESEAGQGTKISFFIPIAPEGA
jgi:signal transduction histidine kinase